MEKEEKTNITIPLKGGLKERVIKCSAWLTLHGKEGKVTERAFSATAIEKECERVEALEKGGQK